jgi:hypothetical protein
MTREEAKKFLPIIQAFAEGKNIETYYYSDKTWRETNNPSFSLCFEYRVKPEPKYRPFNSKEECWNEIQKHEPFAWVIEKEHCEHFSINSIGITGVGGYTYRKAFEELVFADGSPFGIEE